VSDDIEHDRERDINADHVRRVRVGHGANCSSIGSVVDTLFATATVGAALFTAVVAALGREPVEIVKAPPARQPGPREKEGGRT
jgi:hypothetical protein